MLAEAKVMLDAMLTIPDAVLPNCKVVARTKFDALAWKARAVADAVPNTIPRPAVR